VATHGFVYVPFGLVVPGTLRGRAGPSLLLGHIAPAPVVRGAVPVLHVLAGIVFLLCGTAIALAPFAPDLWRPLAIIGSAIGLLAFATLWDGSRERAVEEGAIGAVASLCILAGAFALPGIFS
jgi:hypothetical protein